MVADITASLDQRFKLAWRPASDFLPRFLDDRSGLAFRLLPGGSFQMGFSKTEEKSASKLCDPIPANLAEMRPTQAVAIAPFLLSETPALNAMAGVQRNGRQPDQTRPAFLTRKEAVDLVASLGCRLPWEREWEYACRAGTQSLFVFGDRLPPDLELARWLSTDFSKPSQVRANPFGLRGMFTGEWCQDEFRVTLAEGARVVRGSHVIRGGGAFFWPWQADEWVWCMSAMRMPSKDLVDGRCGLRLAYAIGSTSN
jgi:formylglycine-generating enzyme required for sulfatase activity